MLASKIGVDERLVQRWLTGESGLSLETLVKIAKGTGVSLDWLVPRTAAGGICLSESPKPV
jgi:transcriptional regulator with XRE-family HTH domain